MGRSQLPETGNPNTSVEEFDEKGDRIRRRYFGSDGNAIKNVDYGHDHGVGKPHAHDWDWSRIEPRLPGRPLKAGEG
jgi:hypothetical protein